MNVAVTGSSGFIGSHVVKALSMAGHDVLEIDLRGNHSIDISDTKHLTLVLSSKGVQFIFHLAAIADTRDTLADPLKTVEVNIRGTASVLEAAKNASVRRTIIASTCWVANAMREGELDEESYFLPSGGGHVYITSKITSEMLAHDYRSLYGQSFTVLRYGIPYGPGMWKGCVLRNFLDRIVSGQPIEIYGGGLTSRRFVYVSDLADAHVLSLCDEAENQVYNLDGMRFVTISELADLTKRIMESRGYKVEISYVEDPSRVGELLYDRKILSNRKAYIDLGWQPKTYLEEGVKNSVDWYLSLEHGSGR